MSTAVRIATVMMLGVAVCGVHLVRARVAPGALDEDLVAECQERLETLPMRMGDYRGQRGSHDEEIVIKSGADCHVAAVFVDKQGNDFSVYVGGSVQPEVAFHEPQACLPAAGWRVLEEDVMPFEAFETEDGAAAQVQRLHVRYGDDEMLVYHWFQCGAEVADTVWRSRFLGIWERILEDRQRPRYIVILYVPIRNDLRQTHQSARSFMHALGPALLDMTSAEKTP